MLYSIWDNIILQVTLYVGVFWDNITVTNLELVKLYMLHMWLYVLDLDRCILLKFSMEKVELITNLSHN